MRVGSAGSLTNFGNGFYGPIYITEAGATATDGWSLIFETDAEAVDVCIREAPGTKVRVRIESQYWVSLSDLDVSGDGSTSTYVKYDFGTGNGKPRRWEICFSGPTQIRGLNAGLSTGGSTISNNPFRCWSPATGLSTRLMVWGDDLAYGMGASSIRNGFAYLLGEALGSLTPTPSGVLGQGHLTTSAGGLAAGDRVVDVERFPTLDILVDTYGLYDRGQNITDLQNAVTQHTAGLRAALPNAFIFKMPMTMPGLSLPADRLNAIMNGFNNAADPDRMVFFDPSTTPTIGNVFFTSTNTTMYFNSNGIHLNDRGHAYLARRVSQLILRNLRTWQG
jgi:lysophospholipase L1-like esterase